MVLLELKFEVASKNFPRGIFYCGNKTPREILSYVGFPLGGCSYVIDTPWLRYLFKVPKSIDLSPLLSRGFVVLKEDDSSHNEDAFIPV